MNTAMPVGRIASLAALVMLVVIVATATFAARPSVLTTQDVPTENSDGSEGPTVLITGANRGLGLEFARQFHAAGYTVIATARKPEAADELNALGVRVEQLDVADAESVAALAADLDGRSIDILINNAGITARIRSLETVEFETIERILQVNTLGPMRVTKALLSNLRDGDQKIIVNITSGMGSIKQNTRGGGYGYRESKAALNMFTRTIAAELKPDGFRCITMSPGWVKTDMGGPNARLTPAESIGGMISVINGLTAEDSGEFFNHNGEHLPW